METEEINKRRAQPWVPITNPRHLKYLGKLGEELGEATAALAFFIKEPGTVGAAELERECADVLANVELVASCFGFTLFNSATHHEQDLDLLMMTLGTAQTFLCRCIIQGMDGVDPESGEVNSHRLAVTCNVLLSLIRACAVSGLFNAMALRDRADRKKRFQLEWHEALVGEDSRIIEARGCFEAAEAEGWSQALEEGNLELIRDLYTRRISFAYSALLPGGLVSRSVAAEVVGEMMGDRIKGLTEANYLNDEGTGP